MSKPTKSQALWSIFFPPVGIIKALVALANPNPEAKAQGKAALILGLVMLVLGVSLVLSFIYLPMEIGKIGEFHKADFQIGPLKLTGIHYVTVLWSWVIIAFLTILGIRVKQNIRMKSPNKLQIFFEFYTDAVRNLCRETLGLKKGTYFTPLIATLFLFVACSNLIGVIPSFWRILLSPEGHPLIGPEWLAIEEPTKDLNTTLGLGLLVAIIVHGFAIRYKGWHYFKEYFEPFIGPIPNPLMFVLNLVGEIGKVVSHSFRLFGNIMGGSIIIIVVTALMRYWLPIPLLLQGFFGVFVGIVQAFVFSMLALTYLAVAIGEE